jgi:hypothetical protein
MAVTVLLGACTRARPWPLRSAEVQSLDPPARPGRPLLLVLMPDSPQFHIVRQAMVRELEVDFNFATTFIRPGLSLTDLAVQISEQRPVSVVVMDSPALALYRRYTDAAPPGSAPPAVVMMTPFFIEEVRPVENTTGVSYEVPGVTAFVKLRSLVMRPLRKVAVLHRPRFRDFIDRQRKLAAKEDIELAPVEVPTEPVPDDIDTGLRAVRRAGVDALWVLNDRVLLRDNRFIDEAWRPQLQVLGVPVIVGIARLAAAEARFGDFAVVPDHEELGIQGARLIFRLAESGWQAGKLPVELPLSTITVGNLQRLEQTGGGLKPEAATRVDEVVR